MTILTEKDIDTEVSRQIHIHRIINGVSQKDLASEIGISFQQLQKIEHGKNRVSAGRLFLISELLDTSVPAFYGDLWQPSLHSPAALTADEIKILRSLRKVKTTRLYPSLKTFLMELDKAYPADHKS